MGQRWDAGLLRDDGMRAELRGEILGADDLTIDGRLYPGCLHLRLVGTPRGSREVEGRRVKIEAGRFEQEFWMARGQGLVKAVVRTELDLVGDDGARLKSSGVWSSFLSPRPGR